METIQTHASTQVFYLANAAAEFVSGRQEPLVVEVDGGNAAFRFEQGPNGPMLIELGPNRHETGFRADFASEKEVVDLIHALDYAGD